MSGQPSDRIPVDLGRSIADEVDKEIECNGWRDGKINRPTAIDLDDQEEVEKPDQLSNNGLQLVDRASRRQPIDCWCEGGRKPQEKEGQGVGKPSLAEEKRKRLPDGSVVSADLKETFVCEEEKSRLGRFLEAGYTLRQIAGFDLNGALYEQIYRDGKVLFLRFDASKHGGARFHQVSPGMFVVDIDNQIVYQPIDDDLLRTGLVFLPSGIEEYGDDLALFKDIKTFLDCWHDQPDENQRNLDVLYVKATYLADLLPVIPDRRILGRFSRGKSRWKSCIARLCYHSINLNAGGTTASLRRFLSRWNGPSPYTNTATLVIDEANFKKTEMESVITKIICLGNEQENGFVSLCDEENKPRLQRIFGPKILSSRQEMRDPAAESRMLSFTAKKANRRMPLYAFKKFVEQAVVLRNKLLLWRLENYKRIKEKIEDLENPDLHDLFPEGIDDRIKQIVAPLFLTASDDLIEMLRDIVKELQRQLQDKDEDLAIVNLVKRALFGGEDESGKTVGPMVDMVNTASLAGGEPTVKAKVADIAGAILGEKASRADKSTLSRRICRLAEQELGWRVIRGHGNYAYLVIPESAIPKRPNHANHINQTFDRLKRDPPGGPSTLHIAQPMHLDP